MGERGGGSVDCGWPKGESGRLLPCVRRPRLFRSLLVTFSPLHTLFNALLSLPLLPCPLEWWPQVAVYRLGSLADKRLLFKVEVNAKENLLSGYALQVASPEPSGGGGGHDGSSFAVVVVEGGVKGLKRYKKLMLRRIDWTAPPSGEEEVEEEEEGGAGAGAGAGGGGGGGGRGRANYCRLVWEGSVKRSAFRRFRHEICPTAEAARAKLATAGVGHYFDLASSGQAIEDVDGEAA